MFLLNTSGWISCHTLDEDEKQKLNGVNVMKSCVSGPTLMDSQHKLKDQDEPARINSSRLDPRSQSSGEFRFSRC